MSNFEMSDIEKAFHGAAQSVVRKTVAGVEFNHSVGTVSIPNHDVGYVGQPERLEFDNYESLFAKLAEWSNEQLSTDGYGSPMWDNDARRITQEIVDFTGIKIYFEERASSPASGRILLPPGGLLLPKDDKTLRIDVANVNAELVRYLARRPEKMVELEPRKFEELVAELLRDLGYEVVLTPASKDGGFDIRAYHKTSIGTFLTLVECKRYSPEHPVGVEVVRGLRGVAELEKASFSMIATTSRFTAGARQFVSRVKHQMSLKDGQGLAEWLVNYGGRNAMS
jgi:HJR/Mrr/RecB family endonuclease